MYVWLTASNQTPHALYRSSVCFPRDFGLGSPSDDRHLSIVTRTAATAAGEGGVFCPRCARARNAISITARGPAATDRKPGQCTSQ